MSNRTSRLFSALLASLAVATCVDAPSAPEGVGAPAPFVVAPVFALVGPGGPAVSEAQADALAEAFNKVDHFRMQVRRALDGTLVLDTIMSVTPGEPDYNLSVNLDAKDKEQFLVTLTALQGETELFTAENIPATASPAGTVPGSTPPPAIEIPLVYSGPGATAQSVTVGPDKVVLAPGGSATVGASVLDAGGTVVSGVPLAWSSSSTGVVSVTQGALSAAGEGVATVTATTPTGLAASATVYVVSGTLAYVEGGTLKVRGVAGGTAEDRGSDASQPAWSADGDDLFFVSGGTVHKAGGSSLVSGSWPSLSPDGTKLAVERDGQVFFANEDGSQATAGPSGTAPVWSNGSTLLVGGGSIERVGADGTGRETVIAGEATLPALAADGRVAALVGSELRVSGHSGALVTGAAGRPTWSPDGAWLVVGTGSGLVLVPADGSADPAPLPGLGGASHPAWRSTGSMEAPPTVNITGFNPDPPVPGSPVEILGSGFDWIIPANNRVVWPTSDGATETSIQGVSAGAIVTSIPRNVVEGQVRVESRASTALLTFEPTLGGLDITAQTPWGASVAGVGLTLDGPSGQDTGTTDSGGQSQFSALIPGAYTLTISAPEGYNLDGAAVRNLSIGAAVETLGLTLTPGITSVTLVPDAPTLVAGGSQGVSLILTGAGGVSIPQAPGLTWRSGSPELSVTPGAGLNATLRGIFASEGPGTSVLEVDVDGKTHTFPVTITSSIQGTVTLANGETPAPPAPGITVDVKRGGSVVASATTGADGGYRVAGLFRGTYDVAPRPSEALRPVPEGQTVTLDQTNPGGTADFAMQTFATLEVMSVTPWDTPAGGLTVVLTDGDGNEVARGVADTEGLLRLERIAPGTYTLKLTPPPGFNLTGDAQRTIELVGTVPLKVVLEVNIARVDISPAEITVPVGSTVEVTATALDYNGRVIPEFRSSSWFARTGHVAAGGVGLKGQVGGIYPSDKGGAQFAIELNGQIFDFPVTVTTQISGTVKLYREGGNEPSVGTGILIEKDGLRVAETSTQAGGAYVVDGLLAGTYVVKPGTPSGYSASPAQHSFTLDAGLPRGVADFVITEGVTNTGNGEVIVFGDINIWGSGSYYFNRENNPQLTRNLVTNGSRSKAVWYFGHNTYGYGSYNENYFSEAASYIRNTVEMTLEVVDNTTTGGLALPMDASVWWFWMPQALFDEHDVTYIKQYLAGGGRVILVGENDGSGFNATNARVQSLMNKLGSSGVYTDGCLYGVTSDVATDPLTTGVTSINTACTSTVTLGSGDQALITQGGKSVMTRIHLGNPVATIVTSSAVAGEAPQPANATTDPDWDPALGPKPSSTGGGR